MAAGFDFYVVVKSTNPNAIKNQMIFDFGGAPAPVGIQGFYKTIMQWTKCLLTEQGTDISDPTYGTALAGFIGNNLSDPKDASDLVYTSVRTATDKIKQYQNNASPPTRERLDSAVVTKLVAASSSIDVYITIRSSDGQTFTLSLPTGVRLPPTST